MMTIYNTDRILKITERQDRRITVNLTVKDLDEGVGLLVEGALALAEPVSGIASASEETRNAAPVVVCSVYVSNQIRARTSRAMDTNLGTQRHQGWY